MVRKSLIATVEANEAGKAPPWSGLRAESLAAYQAGRVFDAYDLLRGAVVVDALRWFEEEGVQFVPPDREHTTNELLRGLALAGRGPPPSRCELPGPVVRGRRAGLDACQGCVRRTGSSQWTPRFHCRRLGQAKGMRRRLWRGPCKFNLDRLRLKL